MRILILGGTGEARALAAQLVEGGVDVLSSLAGRVTRPALPVGAVRTGGFGGVEGLATYLEANGVSAVVDATHPFAARISANAVAACASVHVPLLRLQRPGWERHPLAGVFGWVDDIDDARVAAEASGIRPFLTTGRQHLDAFAGWTDRYVLARVVDPPQWSVPASWELLQSRGPYAYAAERALMEERGVDVLVTKDSGGPLTEAKLVAATDLGIPVIVVRRPALPAGVEAVDTPEAATSWVRSLV